MNRPAVRLVLLLLACAAPASAAVRWREVLKQAPAWYATAEAAAVADSVLAYQTDSGGWPKNLDMTLPPTAEYRATHEAEHHAATIDNDATTTQLRLLGLILSTGHPADPRYRGAAERGLDYLFAAQYPNGGWPQLYPLRPGYYTHITYNDDAMANVLEVLAAVRDARPPFAWVDDARRERARAAVDRGIAVILRTQVRENGRLTVWCAQHDEHTLAPAWARNFEPPSLSGEESVGVVRVLMAVRDPSPEVVAAIESAVAWFESARLTGLRIDDTPGADGKKDRHVVADPSAPACWARFYELGTDRPIFVGRDRVIRYDFNAIERERRTGYAYFGVWPAKLLEKDYPRWRQRLHLP